MPIYMIICDAEIGKRARAAVKNPVYHLENARLALGKIPSEQWSEIVKRGHATRKANKETAQRGSLDATN